LEEAKGKLACILGDCGYAEAAKECELRRTRHATTPVCRMENLSFSPGFLMRPANLSQQDSSF